MLKLCQRAALAAAAALPLGACVGTGELQTASIGAPTAMEPRVGTPVQRGQATWYQMGTRTASGERFNPDGMTAAHRSLPFGTRLRVVQESTGRSVVVRINDRGPFTRGKIIDLSRGSARALGLSGTGAVALYRLD